MPGDLGQRAVLGLVQIDKDDALVGDLQRLFVKDEVHALQLGIACLVLAGRNVAGQREALEMPRAVADGSARHVHGRVARADDDDPIAQVVDIGVLQIVDGVVHVAKALALDVQRVGPPDAGADEDGLVAIAEQILNFSALPTSVLGRTLMPFKRRWRYSKSSSTVLGQAELRDAVAQHAADLIVALKDRDVVAVACQNDRNGQARRAGADDGGIFLPLDGAGALGHFGWRRWDEM